MNDPWLTEDGEPCEALMKIGMPEWFDRRTRCWYRVAYEGGRWWRFFRKTQDKRWIPGPVITPHEAHALIEKDAREKLQERAIVAGWLTGSTNPPSFAVCGVRTPKKWYNTYTAALQAAILAKGD